MPPETFHCYPIVTPKTPLLSRASPESKIKQILRQKYYQGGGGRMKFTKYWKLLPVLVLILSSASIFRFLKITMITTMSSSSPSLPSAALPPTLNHDCSPHSASTNCRKNSSQAPTEGPHQSKSINRESSVTDKEMQFVLEFLSSKIPCNLLVFGLQHQYSSIASLNVGGATVFLEDENHNSRAVKSINHTQIYRLMYNTLASDAYRLLKDARKNPDCRPKFYLPLKSNCSLALPNLHQEVYDTMWDVVIVDGPDGGTPDSPGRMAAIYTASILARRGNTSHVLVHDVDRIIEKWFSWEFLCEENLVSSKGRFWHFHVPGLGNATTFCTG